MDYHELAEYLTPLGLYVDLKTHALICYHEKCKRAIPIESGRPSSHLASHGIPLPARVELTRLLRKITLRNPDNLAPIEDGSQKHPYLRLYDGYICRKCDTRTLDRQLIRKHNPLYGKGSCPAIHLEANDTRSDGHIEYVYLQSWSPHRRRQYWIVENEGSIFRAAGGMLVQDHLKSVKKREAERPQTSAISNRHELCLAEESPWLERTGWVDMLKGRDLNVLSAMIETPRLNADQPYVLACRGSDRHIHNVVSSLQDERRIAALLALVDPMMDRCEQTARSTSRNILCWVRSIKPFTTSPKPFQLVRQPGTTRKYRQLLKRFLAFIFRAYRLDPLVREGLTGIRLSKKLVRLLEQLWPNNYCDRDGPNARDASLSTANSNLIDQTLEMEIGRIDDPNSEVDAEVDTMEIDDEDGDQGDGEDDNTCDDGSDYEDDHDSDSSSCRGVLAGGSEYGAGSAVSITTETVGADTSLAPILDAQDSADEVLELLFGLSVALFEEHPIDGHIDSMLAVLFSSILGYSKTRQSFLLARDFTTHLSALIYIQRLLLLEHALPARAYLLLGVEARPRSNQLQRLNKVRKQFLVSGSSSSFDEFFSLRSFGRVAAQSDPPPFLLHWSDDGQSVSWQDSSPLAMSQFRQLSVQLIREAERLCRELMYGIAPTVDLKSIKDNMASKQQGYSFVSDPVNNLGDAYLELAHQACIAVQGGLSHKGGWKWKAVNEYLRKESRFRLVIGLVMQETGGQAARWSELLALLCENSDTAQRGLFAFKSQIMYITRHHKAKRSTNREFIVARFLPAAPSRLLYKYLAYIRPFVDLLQRERSQAGLLPSSESSRGSQLLFRSQSGAGSKAWSSERFNNALKRETQKCWGQTVNSKTMRQLRIGITEKHVLEIHEPFNRYDDKGPNANRNAIFAHQSGHRPRQRGSNYGLDGAFPTKLQPQLLDLYEWAASRWHEFLQLPSKRAEEASGVFADGVTSCDDAKEAGTWQQVFPGTATTPSTPDREPPTWPESVFKPLSTNQRISTSYCQDPIHPRASQQSYAETSALSFPERTSNEGITLCAITENTISTDLATSSSVHTSIATCGHNDSESRSASYTTRPTATRLKPILAPSAGREDTSKPPDLIFGRNPAAMHDAQNELTLFNKFLHNYVTSRQSIGLMHERLSRIIHTTKWWSSLSCPLCFLCGDTKAEHTLQTCKRDALRQKTMSIIRWLDDLRIPQRTAEGSGACSLCLTFYACGEGAATAKNLRDLYSAGRCEIKPTVCMAIASLAAYDGELFRNMLHKVPITTDAEIWLERRISYNGRWVSNLLLAYEEIMLAFYYRRNIRRGIGPLWQFPHDPPAPPEPQVVGRAYPTWDTAEEVASWEAAIGWWQGKCSLCAGHGMGGQNIQHTLRQCTRDHGQTLRSKLAKALYEEKIIPNSGCDTCHLPYEFCDDWEKMDDGEWVTITTAKGVLCQFGRHLLLDTIIGLYHCGERDLMDEFDKIVSEHCVTRGLAVAHDEKTVARALSQNITVTNVAGSQLLRTLVVLTSRVLYGTRRIG